MSTTAVVVIVVIAVLVVLGLALLAVRKGRSRRSLQQRFGPEYDRTVKEAGGTKQAEVDLRARAAERDKLQVRPLDPVQRDRYAQEWRQVQAQFVDAPAQSLAGADVLITQVMTDMGYPMQDFESQAKLVSVDHPQVVENYRTAHAIYVASQQGQTSTEEQRQALVSYRALFDDMLGQKTPPPTVPAPPEGAAAAQPGAGN
jgi:type II secretory pathway pseudopilin PulG